MSSELNKKNEETNGNITSEKKSITFKDWKLLKYGNDKKSEKVENKPKNATRNEFNSPRNTFNSGFSNNFSFNNNQTNFLPSNNYGVNNNYPRNPFNSGFSNNFSVNNNQTNFLPSNNFGVNNFNKFNMRGNDYGSANNCFNNFNPFHNNLSYPNNVDFDKSNNFNNSNGSYNFMNRNELKNSYERNYYEFNNGFNRGDNNYFDKSENCFTSDSMYRQRDFMQKPLSNPFRKYDKLQHSKDGKQKKKFERPNKEKKSNLSHNVEQNISDDAGKQPKDPEIYISNPKTDGKPYIPKPKIPELNSDHTTEEKKLQWKEYRQAMKPFKNRDFHNAKRVVQRLGKTPPSELNEKQVYRLENAKEYIATYKTRLSMKYPNYFVKADDSYVKVDDNSHNMGELYVLKNKCEQITLTE